MPTFHLKIHKFYLPSGNLPSNFLRVLRKGDVYELFSDKCPKNADGETCQSDCIQNSQILLQREESRAENA